LNVGLLCASGVLGLASAGFAQGSGGVETVVVTGSRVISDIANSPTPLVAVSTADLAVTTPSNIPSGLDKLPIFQGSTQPGSSGNGGTSGGINVLALRNFGAQRTLVLFDSHRVARPMPTAPSISIPCPRC